MREQEWQNLKCIPTPAFGKSLCWAFGELQMKAVEGEMEGRQPTERPHRALGSDGPLGLGGYSALLAGEREDLETQTLKRTLFEGSMTDRAPRVLAQEMVGMQSAWAEVPVGQYSAWTARMSTPSLLQGRATLLRLLPQSQRPRAKSCGA